jgi:hypothetical protein
LNGDELNDFERIMRRIRRDEGMDVDPDADEDEDEEEADEEEEEGTASGTRLTGASGSRGPFDYRFLGGGSGSTGECDPRSSCAIRLPISHSYPYSSIFTFS